jgi:hypothetical protein
MRLTLRTLLAYLDQILEPEDAKEIGKKVQESEFASNLSHRIRDCMRRLRLGAPSVTDRGAGLDPNTVAEYLDNTLPDSQVPDFEKVCLESDVHLAEVASCHQILTLVLGEPAEVEPEARQRMYRLPEQPAALAPLPDAAAAIVPRNDGYSERQAGAAAGRQERISRVPDYLRESRSTSRLGRWLAAAVLIAVLLLAALLMTGRVTFPQLAQYVGLDAEEKVTDSGEPSAGRDVAGERPVVKTAVEQGKSAGEITASSGAKTSAIAEPQAVPAADQAKTSKSQGPAVSKVADIAIREPGAAKSGSPEEKLGPAATAADRAVPPPPPRGPERIASKPPAPLSGENNATPWAAPLQEGPKVKQSVGQYITARDVLLRSDNGATGWQRMSDRTPVSSGVKLLSLPVFRPVIQFARGTKLQLVDGTVVEFQAPAAQKVGLTMDYGRLLCKAEEGAGTAINVQIGDRFGLVTLPGTDSAFALEVRRADGDGADPETQPGPIVADLFAVAGKIIWQDGPDAKPVSLTAPYRLALNERSGDRRSHQQFPRWLLDDSVSRLELEAADTLHRAIAPDQAASTGLHELLAHRKKEVRWLAVRCLSHVGDFEPLVNALNDPEQKLIWSDYIDELRAAVIRGPRTAGQVRAAMENRLGNEQGANLYEMLWRYRPGTLKPDDTQRLVKFLDDETMALRVLSYWNLKNLTRDPNRDSSHGLTFAYRPEDTPARRQGASTRWKAYVSKNPLLQSKVAVEDEGLTEPPRGPTKGKPAPVVPPKEPDAEPGPPPAGPAEEGS